MSLDREEKKLFGLMFLFLVVIAPALWVGIEFLSFQWECSQSGGYTHTVRMISTCRPFPEVQP